MGKGGAQPFCFDEREQGGFEGPLGESAHALRFRARLVRKEEDGSHHQDGERGERRLPECRFQLYPRSRGLPGLWPGQGCACYFYYFLFCWYLRHVFKDRIRLIVKLPNVFAPCAAAPICRIRPPGRFVIFGGGDGFTVIMI